MRKTNLIGLTVIFGIISSIAIADGHSNPAIDGAIKARKAQMQLYSFNLGQLGAMAKGNMAYDAEIAAKAASNLSALTKLDQSQMWPASSDNKVAQNTRALPEIWGNMNDVFAKGNALSAAAAKMEIAAGSDLASLQAAMGDLGGACGACHKIYRAPEN